MAVDAKDRDRLLPHIRELARILRSLSNDPGDRETRQEAADWAVGLARDSATAFEGGPAVLTAAGTALRLAVGDFLVFAGVEPADARRAVVDGGTTVDVRTPPVIPRLRFPTGRRRTRR